MNNPTKSYSELIQLKTRRERLEYLMLYGSVAERTFGQYRYLNQLLYKSKEWKWFRNEIIIRDKGWDLGLEGYDIFEHPIIHHINPITKDDIVERRPCVFDRNNVILVSEKTHNIVHYAFSLEGLEDEIVLRTAGDTKLW